MPELTGIAFTLSALWAYAMIVEDHPPILRAVLMASFYLFSYALFRRSHVLNAIGLAAICILALRPSEIYDASFLLSFVAVLAIGGIAVPWLERSVGIYLRALEHLRREAQCAHVRDAPIRSQARDLITEWRPVVIADQVGLDRFEARVAQRDRGPVMPERRRQRPSSKCCAASQR